MSGPINGAIAGLTVRQSLARRRWIVVTLLAALPIVMALAFRAYGDVGDDMTSSAVDILSSVAFTVVVPIVALVLASAGFGAEVEDGTVVYLLAKPIPRSTIAVTKLVVTAACAMALNGVSAAIVGVIMLRGAGSAHLAVAFVVGALLGSALYAAIFLALGLITRRGMLVGLVYLVVWEGVLARLFAGTRTFSVRQYMLSVTDAIAKADASVFTAQLPHGRAYIMSAVVAVAALAFCINRLCDFEIGRAG
ncbi:MAG TPA: ABC transporter permease subunit [Gemmatimonadales bacterium]|jgi:ABC-2 type transport system permease protein